METIKLDYSLKTTEERVALVEKIIAEASSSLTSKYLEILGDYILDALPKEETQGYIITKNRKVTIDKRETSYEELVSKFENGEDGVYNLINNDKNMYLVPKIKISAEDIAEIPGMQELLNQIQDIEAQAARAVGKKKYLLKKQAIEMHQEKFLLKELYKPPRRSRTPSHTGGNRIEIPEEVSFDAKGDPISNAIVTLFNPAHVSAIMCNYSLLREALAGKHYNDFYYLLQDFDAARKMALAETPAYEALVQAKMDGASNSAIRDMLEKDFNLVHSVEYISSLWRNKIPKMIAEKAKENYLIWYFTEIERGNWKKCSRCGQIKLAHHRFFSRNSTAKDGFYSICKECRKKGGLRKSKYGKLRQENMSSL